MRKRDTDRRNYGATNRFPLEDKSGCIIPFNRSKKPDRRLESYRLREIDQEEFNTYNPDPFYGVQ